MNSSTLSADPLEAELARLRTANQALADENRALRASGDATRRSEQHYRLIAENTLDLICEVSQHGAYTYVSPNHHDILGYHPGELLGKNLATLVHRDDVNGIVDKFSHCMVSGQPFVATFRLRHHAGGWRWLELAAKPLETIVQDPDEEPSPYQGQAILVYRDVTERQETRHALATESQRLAVTLTSIADGVIATDLMGEITQINDAALEITGLARASVAGRPLREHLEFFDDDHAAVPSPVAQVLAEGAPTVLTHSGHVFLKTSAGVEFAVAGSAAPIRDEDGRVFGAVFVFRNVTERRRTEQEMMRLGKQESLGLLAARIAHDFNNLLAVILGNLALAKMLLKPADTAWRRLVDTEKACVRAKDLTKQLLAFSRGGLPVRKPLALEPLVRESARLILHDTKARYRLEWPALLPAVNVDAEQIHQLLYELLTNAAEATPEGGAIFITGDTLVLEGAGALPLAPGEYARISIRDEGPGIPKALLTRIFEPFFTTRENSSGLGLATSFLIARNHDGFLTVDTAPGAGATFHLLLPALASPGEKSRAGAAPAPLELHPALPAPSQRGAPSRAEHGRRVLVMDDEAAICELAAELLTCEGYEVQTSANGEEAIRKYESALAAGRPYDVVILDLTVRGGLGGKETIARLREMDPGARAIVSSGYSQDPTVSRYRDFGFLGVVSKPYTVAEMVQEIERITLAHG